MDRAASIAEESKFNLSASQNIEKKINKDQQSNANFELK